MGALFRYSFCYSFFFTISHFHLLRVKVVEYISIRMPEMPHKTQKKPPSNDY